VVQLGPMRQVSSSVTICHIIHKENKTRMNPGFGKDFLHAASHLKFSFGVIVARLCSTER
jgi:hypothetical protein